MRKLSVLIFTLLSLSMAKAEVITPDAARQKAVDFVTNRLKAGKRATTRGVQNIEIAESRNAYHVFNIGEVDGYVVVSGDDRMPDILGYSDNGNFDGKSIPDNLRGWLQGYERQYEYLKTHPDAKLTSHGADSRKPIAPMLECHWDQGSPYNDQCPKGCVTGCVATAMAQIMYYHRWPKQTTKTIPAYTTKTNKYEIPSIDVTTIDWNNIQSFYDDYLQIPASKESKQAVATLMKLCGAAVQMDYDASGSGAYTDGSAFAEYFDYEKGICLFDRKDFTQDTWNNMIYEELENQRPVLYSGCDRTSGVGHSFVVDGYDSNDYFHINFGWGGYCDAFFLLSVISTEDGDDFSYEQDAVVHIQPTSSTKPKPYMTVDNGTLTFCYDSDRDKSKVATYSYSPSSKDFDIISQVTHVIISPSFANYTLYSLSSWFSGFSNVETIEGLGNLNTTYVTDMRNMFQGCSHLTSLDLGSLNTSNVTSMYCMFSGCSSLTSLDMSHLNTSIVTDMSGMFYECSGLTSMDMSGINTSNVTSMGSMFYNCTGLTSLDLSGFNTANVTNMYYMFRGCSKLTTIYASDGWSNEKVKNSKYMFSSCSKLVGGKGTKYKSSNTDHTYARLDGGESAPGYFTSINDQVSLEFQYEGKTLEDNSTVVIEAKKDDLGFGGLNCETNPINNPLNGLIVVTSKGGQNGIAKMEILGNTLNPGIVQWCMGGTCVSMNGKTSFEKSFTTDDNGIAQVQFDANDIKSEGSLEARLTIIIGSHVQTVNIQFVYNSDEHDVPGDVNGDGKVDEADIAEIENYIMGKTSDTFNNVAADMNNDGIINAADIVLIVNAVKAGKGH